MHPRHHLFQSSQLPPPSQLHLPVPSSYSRSNTLPPITHIPAAQQNHSFPYHSTVLPSLPPSPTSQHHWQTQHRTSSSRDEFYPPQQPTLPRSDPARPSTILVKDEANPHRPYPVHHEPQPPVQHLPLPTKEPSAVEDGMPSTSDFVKKLYKMLEDQSFQHVVSWGPQGDCFVVKDMNEFTKSILPRMFKHSNFASFVRQLNKYDFHKVKNTDDNQFGEHSWTFRHPDFHADRRDALENIKRKVPTQRKSLTNPTTNTVQNGAISTSPGPFSSSPTSGSAAAVEALQAQVDRLLQAQEDTTAHIRNLERNYQDVLAEMVNFQRNIAQQDTLTQNLIQYFLQVENGKYKTPAPVTGVGPSGPPTESSDHNPFLPTQEAQRMMGSYPESDVAKASLMQMNEISRRAEVAGMSFNVDEQTSVTGPSSVQPVGSSATGAAGMNVSGQQSRQTPRLLAAAAAGLMGWDTSGEVKPMSREDALARIEELQRSRPTSAQGFGDEPFVLPEDAEAGEGKEGLQRWMEAAMATATTDAAAAAGLQVYTLGHLMPRSTVNDANGNWSFDATTLEAAATAAGAEHTTYGVPEAPETPYGEAEETVNPSPPIPGQQNQMLRVRRSTFVPGWAVPPRVLLVDDDAVSRKLSSKFLQIFGCTTDVAVDGIGAVNKIKLEKYDLVLMDIVMPKLDGVSATSLIRQFDHMTPIISMTSNSKPEEIMHYYTSGMNDILPKPFTKQGLLDMLEKHLMHLKVIQQMSKFPRTVDMPSINSESLADSLASLTNGAGPSSVQLMALASSAMVSNGTLTGVDDDGRINPLAGMGLTDHQYATMLQDIVNGESFPGMPRMAIGVVGDPVSGPSVGEKRGLEDADDPQDVKRSRFEVVE